MPSYEYKCDSCGHEFEEFQGIKDTPLKKCPQCKKNKLRRLISGGAAIVFKGSGFYQTDYRSETYKKAAKAESAESDTKSQPNNNTPNNNTPNNTPAAKKLPSTDNNTKKETQKNNQIKTKE